MKQLRVRIGAIALTGGAAALVLTAGPALAGTQAPAWVTGPEVISGQVHGQAANANSPMIPLLLRGVVFARDDNFILGGNGHRRDHTLWTTAGKLTVMGVGRQHQTMRTDARACHVTFTIRQEIRVLGGKSSGRFAGASGPGAYQIRFSAFFPRYMSGRHRGMCNFSNSAKPLNRGALASFLATLVLTVR